MAKLVLTPNPTFKAPVRIPTPGGLSDPVEFTFRHRTRDEFNAWLAELEGKKLEVAVLEVASGWDLDEAFDAESVARLSQNYMGGPQAIVDVYMEQLTLGRVKN